ncbi:MAG: TlyA family RNA methyltransferase [Actinomycetota bacterium]|nr:TlyA family RNA methyltransferase [Actinomycetota bacterium]
MSKPARLDAELVRRGLFRSRSEAKRSIDAGRVLVKGLPADRAATLVTPSDPISLAEEAPRFVSRGGEKLDGALARLQVKVEGRRWLDAGASTGGFTDRLLQGGAAAVAAVDVGYGQLDWKLRNDPRVVVIERTNIRFLRRGDLPFAPDGVTADLSFISLTVVLPALAAVAGDGCDHVLMVKPQFEVGREAVGRGGVVRDPDLWRAAVEKVVMEARELGLGLVGVAPSLLPGPAGNREFFVHLRAGREPDPDAIDRAIAEVSA